MDLKVVKKVAEEKLNKRLIHFSLQGQGMWHYAWYALSEDNQKYLIKQEKSKKEEEEQNDLLVEASIIRKLNEKNPTLPVPHIVFVAEDLKMYGYFYIKGELMKNAWTFLSQQEKIALCKELWKFHAQLTRALTTEELHKLKLANSQQAASENELEDDVALFLNEASIPQHYKLLVEHFYQIHESTKISAHFGLCHNDSHHENILLNKGKLAGIIDFGDSTWGDVHCEFARYFQDYPQYFEIIVKTYEKLSGKTLSRNRIMAIALLDTIDDLRTEYITNGRIEWMDQLLPWVAELSMDR